MGYFNCISYLALIVLSHSVTIVATYSVYSICTSVSFSNAWICPCQFDNLFVNLEAHKQAGISGRPISELEGVVDSSYLNKIWNNADF